MANERLKRKPTTEGNRSVYTWSAWIKRDGLGAWARLYSTAGQTTIQLTGGPADKLRYLDQTGSNYNLYSDALLRDTGNWMHLLVSVDHTRVVAQNRVKLYINGTFVDDHSTYETSSIRAVRTYFNSETEHSLLGRETANAGENFQGKAFDIFWVDGQALTPDVFGYYSKGDGYISVGTTQSHDFRPGQWVPKAPRIIKSYINSKGGFGTNGFYLPLNDSSNFGADFHCAPNSIIKLKGEDLPQPRNGAPETTNQFVDQLRDDPYKDHLVLAIPGILDGKEGGIGDYSADIKGSGVNKKVKVHGWNTGALRGNGVGVAVTPSYYGSAIHFDNFSGNRGSLSVPISEDLDFGNEDFTIEYWQKLTTLNGSPGIGVWDSSNNQRSWVIYINNSGLPRWYVSMDGTNSNNFNASFPTIATQQWVHLAMEREGTDLRGYVDGVVVGIVTNLKDESLFSPRDSLKIGEWSDNYIDGYLQDIRIYKGVAKYKGGFDISKPYEPIGVADVGIATWRAVSDTTTNNFATLNGTSIPSKYTITEGNLRFTNSTTNWTGFLEGTVGFSTGKYYWETRVDVSTDYHHIGIVGVGITHFNTADSYKYGISYQTDGRFWAQSNGGSAFGLSKPTAKTVGDIVQVAVDMNNKKMWIGINGNWIDSGDPIAGTGENFDSTRGFDYQHYVPFYDSYGSSGLSINFGQNPTFGGKRAAGTNTDDNGRGLFSYDVPTGFLALCEDNLPTPAIADPGKHFKTVLYTGDGNTGRSITGVGFAPDFVWLKSRTSANNHQLLDSVRGWRNLSSNNTNTEGTNPAINGSSDGFSHLNGGSNNFNGSGNNYVAWCWKAGGAAVSNTDGTITSQVSANQDAGFSIVSWTGNGSTSTETVGHGLNKTPSFTIAKARDTATEPDWWVYFGSNDYSRGRLNLTNAFTISNGSNGLLHASNSGRFTLPVAGTFLKENNIKYIAYTWAEIEGFSKFGSYVGNASADGPFVYCGFKPAVVIIKWADGSASWVIQDSSRTSTNPSTLALIPNSSGVELDASTLSVDFLSNGFKIRNTNGSYNNASTYIFAAWAESPFTTANAK